MKLLQVLRESALVKQLLMDKKNPITLKNKWKFAAYVQSKSLTLYVTHVIPLLPLIFEPRDECKSGRVLAIDSTQEAF